MLLLLPQLMPSWKRHGIYLVFHTTSNDQLIGDIRDIKSPIIIQVSQGGSAYYAGKGLANGKQEASIAGAIAAAHHVRLVSKAYGVYGVQFKHL